MARKENKVIGFGDSVNQVDKIDKDATQLSWKPTPRQSEFLQLPDTIFEALYGGAAGGGKTEALLNLPLAKNFHQHPRFKGILFRRTFPELDREVIPRALNQGLYSGCGARYNQEKKRWTFPSGAIMGFSHLEYDKDVRGHDTAEYNYIAFDELTSFTEYMYTFMFSRSRSSSSNLPALVRSGTNPGNVGHAWVRARFVEPADHGTIILDPKSGLKRIFIQSFATDNPHLMENDPQYINRLMGMAERDRRAKLDGDWYVFGGQVFGDYREVNQLGEPENANHIVEPFLIPTWWPKILCIDWGFNAMCYVLWGAISPGGRLYLYREYAVKEAKISDWATTVKHASLGETFYDAVICQSASQQRGEELTIAEQFEKYSGIRVRLSQNEAGSRVASKLILQELFRWRQIKLESGQTEPYNAETAQKILRLSGTNAYKDYLAFFAGGQPEYGIPRIQIFENLKVLRRTIPLCVYDEVKKEDVAEFNGDDPYDCLRYMARAFDRFRQLNVLEGMETRLVSVGQVIQELEQNKDWTSYYRKMDAIERKSIEGSVRPFHRGRRMRGSSH